MNRRAFLATLAGAILGKVVGPKLVAEPTAAAWEAANRLPPLPYENTYVTLETFCAETLRIVDEELKWLKLQRVHGETLPYRMGDTVMVREPARLDLPFDLLQPIIDKIHPVTLNQMVGFDMDLRDVDLRQPFDRISTRHVEPVAVLMAERITHTIKHRGGAEILASVDMPHVPGVPRSVCMSRPEAGLSIRGIEAVVPRYWNGTVAEYRPLLRLQMLYGLG